LSCHRSYLGFAEVLTQFNLLGFCRLTTVAALLTTEPRLTDYVQCTNARTLSTRSFERNKQVAVRSFLISYTMSLHDDIFVDVNLYRLNCHCLRCSYRYSYRSSKQSEITVRTVGNVGVRVQVRVRTVGDRCLYRCDLRVPRLRYRAEVPVFVRYTCTEQYHMALRRKEIDLHTVQYCKRSF